MSASDEDPLLARLAALRKPPGPTTNGVPNGTTSLNTADDIAARVNRLSDGLQKEEKPRTQDDELEDKVARFLSTASSSPPVSPIRPQPQPRKSGGSIVDPSIEIQFFSPPSTNRSKEEEEELIRKLQDELDVETAHDAESEEDIETTFQKLQRDMRDLKRKQDPEVAKLEEVLGVPLNDRDDEEVQSRLETLKALGTRNERVEELGPPPDVGTLDDLRKSIGGK
ncbi:hypothetical protein BT69DRAFT_1332144 [Atractiella rhizophila]|nr:hypothetical protein BT69DRAFT_1332144 [Atractiella rhizophila]